MAKLGLNDHSIKRNLAISATERTLLRGLFYARQTLLRPADSFTPSGPFYAQRDHRPQLRFFGDTTSELCWIPDSSMKSFLYLSTGARRDTPLL